MASEKLIIELWEIVQKNNKEEISYKDFESDLNKTLNLPKDEIDRALFLMISQAEVNPNIIGNFKGGSFMISQSFAAAITSAIKYENQFIPGKQEYIARKNGDNVVADVTAIAMVGLTSEIVDKMIQEYSKLSLSEKNSLWDNYSKMDFDQRRALRRFHDKELKEIFNNKTLPENVRDAAEKAIKMNASESILNKESAKVSKTLQNLYRSRLQKMQVKNPEEFNVLYPNLVGVDINTLTNEQLCEANETFDAASRKNQGQIIDYAQNVLLAADKIGYSTIHTNVENYYNTTDITKSNEAVLSSGFFEEYSLAVLLKEEERQNDLIDDFSGYLNEKFPDVSQRIGFLELIDKTLSHIKEEDILDCDDEESIADEFIAALKKTGKVSTEDRALIFDFCYSSVGAPFIESVKNDKESVREKIIYPILKNKDLVIGNNNDISSADGQDVQTLDYSSERIPDDQIKAFSDRKSEELYVDESFDERTMKVKEENTPMTDIDVRHKKNGYNPSDFMAIIDVVRSGDMREVQEVVTSLVKSEKNVNKDEQEIDETEQGE